MSGLSFRRLTFMLLFAFLVWSSSTGTCHARRGKHWRHSRAASASLSKKKAKSHGSGSHHHGGSKSKSKAPSPPKQEVTPPPPEKKGSETYNVLDFGAKGDGDTDDTKVIFQLMLVHSHNSVWFFLENPLAHYNAAIQILSNYTSMPMSIQVYKMHNVSHFNTSQGNFYHFDDIASILWFTCNLEVPRRRPQAAMNRATAELMLFLFPFVTQMWDT